MKKLALLPSVLLAVSLLYAEPQEVQPVVNITPDKPVEIGESKPLSLPTPPAEIKADVKAVDLKTTTTPKHSATAAHKKTKSLTEMSQEEQVTYLKRKIDKLRKKSHTTRAKIHALESELAALKQEIKDLKEQKKNS